MRGKEELSHNEEDVSEELFEHHRFVAAPGQKPYRVDKFLHNFIEHSSRTKIQQAADAGNILVNGKPVKSNYKVKAGDIVSVVLPHPPRETELIPENIPLKILYKDDHLIVLNKQPGLVVHPGVGNHSGTLVNGLLYYVNSNLPLGTNDPIRPGLVHRLDKNTSGIMVVALNEFSMMHLARQFFERTTSRTYHAVVWGDLTDDEGTIVGNVGRNLKDRKVMDVFPPESKYGKHAVTHYKVLRRFGYVTYVECRLETGRTHQIRVHMKHIGHPLFNDWEYGGDKILKGAAHQKYTQFIHNCVTACPRHALHAKTLAFDHPASGERMTFDSDLPEDMAVLLEKWERFTEGRSL
ncbi:MAG: RluA family pseudouridine synthase [Thermaurantimonas sp.]